MTSADRVIEAGDVQLLRVRDQATVPLSSLYATSPVVLVFFRRWGCQLCRGYAKLLTTSLLPTLQANGVPLCGVGLEMLGLEDFKAGRYFDSEQLYVDDGQKAYRALGLQRLNFAVGLFTLLGSSARAWNRQVQAMGVSGDLKGDGMQLGATYVLGQDGRVWFEHKQQGFGDHPDVQDIVRALQQHLPNFKVNAQVKSDGGTEPVATTKGEAVGADVTKCSSECS